MLASALTPLPATAQSDSWGSNYRGISVSERERRNNAGAGTGVRLGSFLLNPTLFVDGRYNDNIFATDADRRGDAFLTARPEVTLRSDFGRNALAGLAYFQRSFHAKYEGEDVSQYGGTLDGRYDISRTTRLSGRFTYDRAAESRGILGTFRQTSRPAQFTSLIGEAALAQDLGSLSLSAGGRVRTLRYSDALLGTVPIDQGYRDLDIGGATFSASYGFHELTRLVVVTDVERRRYRLRPGEPGFDPVTSTDRSSDGFRIEAGVSRELTALVTGSLRIGYLRYNYADARLRDIAGFSYSGDLDWRVTPLTTVTASASRRLDETTSPVTAGNLRDEFRLRADHELLRRLVLNGDVRFASIRPSSTFATSREYELSAGARYYIGRNIRVEAELRRNQRSSRDRSIAFRSNSVLVGLRLMR
jgi:hypothetical protein